jgi:hypothetical protein
MVGKMRYLHAERKVNRWQDPSIQTNRIGVEVKFPRLRSVCFYAVENILSSTYRQKKKYKRLILGVANALNAVSHSIHSVAGPLGGHTKWGIREAQTGALEAKLLKNL